MTEAQSEERSKLIKYIIKKSVIWSETSVTAYEVNALYQVKMRRREKQNSAISYDNPAVLLYRASSRKREAFTSMNP